MAFCHFMRNIPASENNNTFTKCYSIVHENHMIENSTVQFLGLDGKVAKITLVQLSCLYSQGINSCPTIGFKQENYLNVAGYKTAAIPIMHCTRLDCQFPTFLLVSYNKNRMKFTIKLVLHENASSTIDLKMT
jgi:uncharacterized membrane protein YcfT